MPLFALLLMKEYVWPEVHSQRGHYQQRSDRLYGDTQVSRLINISDFYLIKIIYYF